jgi:hypothetical protein
MDEEVGDTLVWVASLTADGKRRLLGLPGVLAAVACCVGIGAPTAATAAATPALTPVVVTETASPAEATGAILHASVNPNEAEVKSCQAEYGPTSTYGFSAPCEPEPSGHAPVAVTARAGPLQPGGSYHFRFSLRYATPGVPGEMSAYGPDASFVTAPSAITWSPSVWLSYSGGQSIMNVTLQGYVEVHGATVTSCEFEYGTSTALGATATCSQNLGSSSGMVSAGVGALQWSTAYYVRLSAGDTGGSTHGAEQAFQTPARVIYTPYTPPPPYIYTPRPTPYPTYTPPSGGTRPYVSPRSAALARCMRLRGAARTRCLAALRRSRGQSGPASDRGLSVYYCPYGRSSRNSSSVHAAAASVAHAASTSEAGWPPKECLKMDKGSAGQHHTIVGMHHVHNWLLGGWGSDTIVGGERGDVIWADYQACCWPKHQTAIIHAGNGRNVIYANDTLNYVWTGTNPRTVVHAHASGISGVIHCQSPAIVLYLSTVSERHFKLDGCHHISHYSVGY